MSTANVTPSSSPGVHSRGVIVVGSVNVDFVTAVPRLPRPGETILGGVFTESGGGKGANQAIAAARLGAPTWLIGATGDDRYGERARAELAAAGVETTFLARRSVPTGIAQILVDAQGENMIAVASGANATVDPPLVREAFSRLLAPGWVVLANLEVPDAAVATAATLATHAGATFILNPAPARPLDPTLLARCTILTPNESELERLCDGSDAAECVASLLAAGVKCVIVTRGAHGADLYRQDGSVVHQPAFQVEAVDSTGAGDAFNGALAWALAAGECVEQALRLAAATGALATRAVGARASLPNAAELAAFLAKAPPMRAVNAGRCAVERE